MLQNHSQVQVRRHWMNFFIDTCIQYINRLYKFEINIVCCVGRVEIEIKT